MTIKPIQNKVILVNKPVNFSRFTPEHFHKLEMFAETILNGNNKALNKDVFIRSSFDSLKKEEQDALLYAAKQRKDLAK